MATFQEVVERINARRSWVTSAFWPKFQGKSSARRKQVAVAEVMVSRIGQVVWWVIAVAATVGAAPAVAQSNLDAGKSPAQVFSDTCNACHRSPREIRPAGPGFLRQHYTTGGREAAAMAAYLASRGPAASAAGIGRRPGACDRRHQTFTGSRCGQASPSIGEHGSGQVLRRCGAGRRRPCGRRGGGRAPRRGGVRGIARSTAFSRAPLLSPRSRPRLRADAAPRPPPARKRLPLPRPPARRPPRLLRERW